MKNHYKLIPAIIILIASAFILSCSSVTMTSWMNPKASEKSISKLVVWGMFDKLEYEQPFESTMAGFFNQKGLKSVMGLDVLVPKKKYEYKELEKIFDSIGADAILIFHYKGTDKDQTYVEQTTTVYPDFYYNYYNYYSWGYPTYAPSYGVVSTGGYWTVTTVVNLRANLYGNSKDDLIWTGEIGVTDPQYIDQASADIARNIWSDWKSKNLVK